MLLFMTGDSIALILLQRSLLDEVYASTVDVATEFELFISREFRGVSWGGLLRHLPCDLGEGAQGGSQDEINRFHCGVRLFAMGGGFDAILYAFEVEGTGGLARGKILEGKQEFHGHIVDAEEDERTLKPPVVVGVRVVLGPFEGGLTERSNGAWERLAEARVTAERMNFFIAAVSWRRDPF